MFTVTIKKNHFYSSTVTVTDGEGFELSATFKPGAATQVKWLLEELITETTDGD